MTPVLIAVLLGVSAGANDEIRADALKLPDGFTLEVYTDEVPSARAMALGSDGTLYVGSRGPGKVYAVPDADRDGQADQVHVIAEDLQMPTGITYHEGALYIGAVGTIYRLDDIGNALTSPPDPVVVTDAFPKEQHHGWKFIDVGPDGKLYVPVGAPCNICDESGFAEIRRMNLDGTGIETFARGVRNTVGFAWHPSSQELWFTDNGRDWLGDDSPPCELNHAPRAGLHFGYPYCHGDDIADPEFGDGKSCDDFRAPAQNLGPHVAPLGMAFYTGDQFPERYRNAVFVAEHGSWNRSKKIGYRVSVVTLDGDRATGYETFAEGWLQGQENWGRPTDVLVMPDGALLIADDQAGAIYRVRYEGAASSASAP